MRPWDLARSALGVRGVFASLFDQRPSPPKATRGRPHTAGRLCALQKPRDCGTKHNWRKFAQAAKTSIDSSTDITNSLSVIPSEGEESLDIFPILLPGQSRTNNRSAAASFSRP